MTIRFLLLLAILAIPLSGFADAEPTDPTRDILVTFDNQRASPGGAGVGAPYKHRKRYSISAAARAQARAVAREYGLEVVDHWPIKSLTIYCYVYRVADPGDRSAVIARLQQDRRVESVQALQSFETSMDEDARYDDTYANLQHGLVALNISGAHRYSTGNGIRIAIVDSDADTKHEDLAGRLRKTVTLGDTSRAKDADHGTAVASIIGAHTNNATGIVGIAPGARLELFVSCWHDGQSGRVVCDTFTLAKAIDALLAKPPQILNLSLTGPFDPLLERLLREAIRQNIVIIAAEPADLNPGNDFPSTLDGVIGVSSSLRVDTAKLAASAELQRVFAPGSEILVALPDNQYDLRSGSSLAAAHVSGVVALLLAVAPDLPGDVIYTMLQRSQLDSRGTRSVDACELLRLAGRAPDCNS